MMDTFDVALGPNADLHTGLHGALLHYPPPGVRYRPCDVYHHFLFSSGLYNSGDIFASLSEGELIDFGSQPVVVHSSKWPVIGSRGWVVDMDDFGLPMFLSHFAHNASALAVEGSRATRSESFARTLQRRTANMFNSLAHDSCKAIFLHTETERQRVCQWIGRLAPAEARDRLYRKLEVIHAVQAPIAAERVEAKWSAARSGALQIVCCARYFHAKNGPVAIRVARRLRARFPHVRLVYIGPTPGDLAPEIADAGIVSYACVENREVRELLADSHILFHPSWNESVGAVYLEAMATGLAIVAACGSRTEHLRHWFQEAGAFLLDPAAAEAQGEEAAYERVLAEWIRDPTLPQMHAQHNYGAATVGNMSIDHRNSVLGQAYDRCRREPAVAPLAIEDLLQDSRVWRCHSSELYQLVQAYQRRRADEPFIHVKFEV